MTARRKYTVEEPSAFGADIYEWVDDAGEYVARAEFVNLIRDPVQRVQVRMADGTYLRPPAGQGGFLTPEAVKAAVRVYRAGLFV